MTDSISQFVGDWKGFVTIGAQTLRVVLRFRLEAGKPNIQIDNPDSGELTQSMEDISLDGKTLRGTLRGGFIEFRAVFQKIDLLSGQIRLAGTVIPIELSRDNPDFVKFDTPRLDEDGHVVERYVYQPPEQLKDGLAVGALEDVKLDPAQLTALMNAVLAGEYPQTHSILIARRGRLVLEEYFYGHEREKLHTIQSVTKSITSILVGIAMDRGEIQGVHQKVFTLFPERSGFRWVDERYDLSLWHLLTMTAALQWEEDLPYTDARNDNTAMNRSGDWIGYVLNRKISGKAGEKYMYTSGLSILLGGILKNATGLYADEYAEKHLFAPLEITQYSWFNAPDGARHTGGGLALRARDLLKIGEMMRCGGYWQEKCVVSTGWVKDSTRQQTSPQDYAYGYQWHIRRFDQGGRQLETYCGIGYGGQYLFIFPELELVAVFNAGVYKADPKMVDLLEKYILPAVMAGS